MKCFIRSYTSFVTDGRGCRSDDIRRLVLPAGPGGRGSPAAGAARPAAARTQTGGPRGRADGAAEPLLAARGQKGNGGHTAL